MEAIVAAAGRLLVTRGYARASTNEIARVAGVSVGSLYQYFADKDAIFREILRRHHDQVHALVEDHLHNFADVRRDPLATMDALLRGMIALHREDPPLMRALVHELGGLGGKVPGPHAGDLDGIAAVERLLRLRGDLAVEDPNATAWLLVVIVSQVSAWLAHEAPSDLDPEPILRQTHRAIACLLGLPAEHLDRLRTEPRDHRQDRSPP